MSRTPSAAYGAIAGPPAWRHLPIVTRLLLATYVVLFLVDFFVRPLGLGAALALDTGTAWARPWTLVSYPLASSRNPIALLLGCYMLWQFGSDVERTLGSRRFALFFASVTIATGLALALGTMATGARLVLHDLWMPISAVIAFWCLRRPDAQILLAFVIPVRAIWILWIDIVVTFFSIGIAHPLLGFFGLAGIGVATLWARAGGRGAGGRRNGGDWLRRWQRWRASRRIAKHGLRIVTPTDDESEDGNGKGRWVH